MAVIAREDVAGHGNKEGIVDVATPSVKGKITPEHSRTDKGIWSKSRWDAEQRFQLGQRVNVPVAGSAGGRAELHGGQRPESVLDGGSKRAENQAQAGAEMVSQDIKEGSAPTVHRG